MASRLWQAVTPEPQYITTSGTGALPSSVLPLGPQLVRRLERLVVGQVALEEIVPRAGDVAGDLVERLALAAKARLGSRVDEHATSVAEPRRHLVGVEPPILARLRRRMSRGARLRARRARRAPRGSIAPNPPSSTATASWPMKRSIHHSRDAYMPLSAS